MKIGFSFSDLALGGAQTWMVQLASGLAERSHAIHYYLPERPGDSLHTAPALLASLDAVAQRAKRPAELLKADVIQLDGYHGLRRKLPYIAHLGRCVETYHSLYSIRRSGPIYARHRVAVSRTVQAALGRPAQVIPCGVWLPAGPNEEPKEYDLAILGRIHPVKQHLLFLSVCELLLAQRGQLSALIIGGHPEPGPYQRQVEAEIARLKELGLRLHLTGEVPPTAVYGWLEQARVLLVTSENEGFGRMAVEALACGVPVVANPVGGLLEIVQEGRSGSFARWNDPASFAAQANRLLEDEPLRRQFGQQGREAVEERFSLAAMLDAYESLYRQVARSTRTANRR